jgi:hypothetical protein
MGIQVVVERDQSPHIHKALAICACFASIALPGWLSLQLARTDDGQVVTVAQVQERMAAERLRIANDPHIPPQAKAIALGYSNRAPHH